MWANFRDFFVFFVKSWNKNLVKSVFEIFLSSHPALWNVYFFLVQFLEFHFLHIEKSILFCGNPREGGTNTEFILFFYLTNQWFFKSIMWLKILFVWHLYYKSKLKFIFSDQTKYLDSVFFQFFGLKLLFIVTAAVLYNAFLVFSNTLVKIWANHLTWFFHF